MCRVLVTVVIGVWAAVCTVAGQEPPREPPRFPPGSEPRFPPGLFKSEMPLYGFPFGSWSPLSRPARRPTFQVLAEPVPVVPAGAGARQHQRLVLRLRSAPANELANTLNNLLRAEGQAGPAAAARHVVVVPEATGNSLLIGGPPAAVDEIRQLVEELDRPAALVLLEVVIAQAPAGAVKPAQTKTLARVRLVAANNQPASLTVGRFESRSGSRLNVIDVKTGLILQIRPRVGPDGTVVFQTDIVESRIGAQPEGAAGSGAEDHVTLPKPIEILRASTTLCLRDGETAVFGPQPPQAQSGEQVVILVTPHAIHPFANP
jgi:hypothetical protein